MDPNPTRFPILSYVMSQINPHLPLIGPRSTVDSPSSSEIDIEQPSDVGLLQRMPHLNEPHLLASMAHSISDVAHTRSVLQSLGPRPDHESVDYARAKIADIESRLLLSDEIEMEIDRRKEAAEKEARPYRVVVQLDEMHEAYEKLLRDAEERLVRMYGSAVAGGAEEGLEGGVNEAVVEVLQEASAGKEVERVDLAGRELRLLPEAFGRIRGLVALNLSNNLLEVIPDSIAGLVDLAELNLSSNLLKSLPDSIGLLFNLKILNVSGNKLKALPDSISYCRSLVELDVSFNNLTYLPTKIGYELVKLQKLSVYLNKIRSLPTSICEMKSLRHLDAHFNELHGLPRSIGRLLHLEVLNLGSNFSDLTELPDTIGDLTNLRELDLSNNQIRGLPVTIRRLDKLTKLNLDQNPLAIPPPEVVNKGVEAIKEYMARRWLDILQEEEQERILEVNNQSQAGWLGRSASWLNNWTAGLSESVSGYLGTRAKSHGDPYLDQQL